MQAGSSTGYGQGGRPSSLPRRAVSLIRLMTAPHMFGFYSVHDYLSGKELEWIHGIQTGETGEDPSRVTETYERQFSRLLGKGEGVSFASGRMAFYCFMKHLGIGPGDEVIIPGFTCSVVATTVMRAGAEPVFADIDPMTLGSDPASVAKHITPRTKLVVAQHSFGIPCDIAGIAGLCSEHGIPLLEDSAITLGSAVQGRMAGTWGDAAFFSTDHSKPLNTLVGGFLYSEKPDIIGPIRSLAHHLPTLDRDHQDRLYDRLLYERVRYSPGRYPGTVARELLKGALSRQSARPVVFLEDDYLPPAGQEQRYAFPAGMPPFLAALGLCELSRWPDEGKRRRALLERYLECTGDARIPIGIPGAYHDPRRDIVPLRFAFCSPSAEGIKQKLGRYFDVRDTWFMDPLVCCPRGPESLGYRWGSCPRAERVNHGIINVPCTVPRGWEDRAVDDLRKALNEWMREEGGPA